MQPERIGKIATICNCSARALALKHPAYGCNRHEAMLALEGVRVSSITIQKILHDLGLGTKIDRWLALVYDRMKTAVIGEDEAGVVTYNAALVGWCRECCGNYRAAPPGRIGMSQFRPPRQGRQAPAGDAGFPSRRSFASAARQWFACKP